MLEKFINIKNKEKNNINKHLKNSLKTSKEESHLQWNKGPVDIWFLSSKNNMQKTLKLKFYIHQNYYLDAKVFLGTQDFTWTTRQNSL